MQIKPVLVVLDTLARCMVGGDENHTKDMVQFIDRCNDIMQMLGCTVLLVHHANKSGLQERGNTSLRAACDVMIRMSQEDDLIRIGFDKVKDAKPDGEKLFKLLQVQVSETDQSCVLVEDQNTVNETDDLSDKQLRVLEILAMAVYSEGATYKDLLEETEYKRGSVTRALNQLITRKYVEKAGQKYNVLFKINESGMAILATCQEQNQPD
jgi:DNA-binding MarR family transcriptional regulator